jgi:hypothetical protein
MSKEEIQDNELDEVARATLNRYRAKAKAKFRAKGGINTALEKQDKFDKEASPNKKYSPMRSESIVDLVMSLDEIPFSAYRDTMEERCDAVVDAKKEELKQSLFAFNEAGHSAKQLKQASAAHDYETTFPADDEDDVRKQRKHRKAAGVANGLLGKLRSAGVSHTSKLPKGK